MYRIRSEQRLLLSLLLTLFAFTLFVAMLFSLLGWLQAVGSGQTAVLPATQLISATTPTGLG